MRIGIDARELGPRPTGTGRYLAALLSRWSADRELQLTLFTNAPAADLAPWHARGASVVSLPARRGTWFEQVRLPRALRTAGLDVFFSPAFSCPVFAKLPRVTAVHDLSFFAVPDDFTWREGLRRRTLVGASIRASTLVLTLSQFMKEEIARRFPEAAAKTRVIAPAAEAVAKQREPPPQAGPPVLLSVGSLFNRRRMPELLAACALLRRQGRDFRLHVVGDNRTHPRWDGEAQARALGIEDAVRFDGFIDDGGRESLLATATAAIYLSRYEGFGLPALEALAAGLPLVISQDRPLTDLFGSAALVADASQPQRLAETLARVLDDAELRASLARRGPELARSFSWDTCAAQTLAALRDAAGPGQP